MSDASEQDDFRLEADELTDLQKKRRETASAYRHKVAYYCQRYARTLEDGKKKNLDRKTVERWISHGREVGELPPLDHPEQMAEWWRTYRGQKMPAVFLEFEDQAKPAGPAEKSAPAGSEPPAADPDEKRAAAQEMERAAKEAFQRALSIADESGLGFEAALERARLAERFTHAQWQAVILEPEAFPDSVRSKRQKAWEDSFNILARAEEKAEKLMASSEEWAKWSEVEAEYGPKISVAFAGMRSSFTRAVTKVSLPPGLFEKLNVAFQAEIDRLVRVLGEGGFAPVLELEQE